MSRRIRLLVADDHAVVREGLIRILQHEDDLEVVAEAENGLATLRKVREFQPDVLLLDIAMPECNGMEVLQVLRKEGSRAAVVVLSMYDNESYIREVFRSGAAGYVLKASDVAEICQAIRAAARGELFLSNEIRRKVMKGFLEYAPASAMQTRFDALSAQERKVLILLATGSGKWQDDGGHQSGVDYCSWGQKGTAPRWRLASPSNPPASGIAPGDGYE